LNLKGAGIEDLWGYGYEFARIGIPFAIEEDHGFPHSSAYYFPGAINDLACDEDAVAMAAGCDEISRAHHGFFSGVVGAVEEIEVAAANRFWRIEGGGAAPCVEFAKLAR